MRVEHGVSLRPYNSFGLPAVARTLVRVQSDADVRRVVDDPALGRQPLFVLGGGSNIVLTRDMPQVVLKVEVMGRRLVEERTDAWIEAGAGEPWHDFVMWTIANGLPGLEDVAPAPWFARCRGGRRRLPDPRRAVQLRSASHRYLPSSLANAPGARLSGPSRVQQ